jgi:hypothetical protein
LVGITTTSYGHLKELYKYSLAVFEAIIIPYPFYNAFYKIP